MRTETCRDLRAIPGGLGAMRCVGWEGHVYIDQSMPAIYIPIIPPAIINMTTQKTNFHVQEKYKYLDGLGSYHRQVLAFSHN